MWWLRFQREIRALATAGDKERLRMNLRMAFWNSKSLKRGYWVISTRKSFGNTVLKGL